MILAFVRLITIALATIFCLVLAVFGLRYFGDKQEYTSYAHNLVDGHPWVIAMDGDTDESRPPQSRSALTKVEAESAKFFLGLTVRLTQDEHWILYAPKNLSDLTDGQGYVSQHTLADVQSYKFKNSTENILSIEEVLAAFPEARFWIDVMQPDHRAVRKLVELFDTPEKRARVVFTSPFMDTMHDIRDLSVDWLTAATTSEMAKARFLTSLWLEPLLTLPGEVLVLDQNNERLMQELLKRQKVVLLATDDASLFSQLWSQFHLSGVVTKRPSEFATFLGK